MIPHNCTHEEAIASIRHDLDTKKINVTDIRTILDRFQKVIDTFRDPEWTVTEDGPRG